MEVLGALFLSSDERERERNPIVENPLAREREKEECNKPLRWLAAL
jgi:hypothetical protein